MIPSAYLKILFSDTFQEASHDPSKFADGIELRIEAERNAATFFHAHLGRAPLKILRFGLRSFSRCRQQLLELAGFEITLLKEAYRLRYKVSLEEGLTRSFFRGEATKLKELLALREQLQMPESISTPYSSVEFEKSLCRQSSVWSGIFLLECSKAEREKRIIDYEREFGSLREKIKATFTGWEQELLIDLVEHGEISHAKLLYLCILGLGTDEEGLRDVLSVMSPTEIATARVEFRRIWNERAPWYERPFPSLLGDLEKRVWIETGGDSWFDLQEFFCSFPEKEGARDQRLRQLYYHERSGTLIRSLKLLSSDGRRMRASFEAVEDFQKEIAQRYDTPPTAGEHRYLSALQTIAENDCRIFRSFKHFIGNIITNMIATVSAAGAAFALTLEHFSLGTVMVAVGITSFTFRILLKRLLKGRGYHKDEIGIDLFFGVLDGATLFASYLFRQALIQSGARFVTKLLVRTGATKVSVFLGNPIHRRELVARVMER
jgi:hypothetical protein